MPEGRRRQADRSAATRAALADAATDVLVERGWAAVTAIEVCARAGVSRGAFHHHYDSLPQLLADALRRHHAAMRSGPTVPVHDLTSAIDATWAALAQPRFKAVLEAWLAMANDPTLAAEIGPVVAEFAALVDPEQASDAVFGTAEERGYYVMAREALLGLALGRAANGGRPLDHEAAVVATLRSGAVALTAERL